MLIEIHTFLFFMIQLRRGALLRLETFVSELGA